MLRSRTFAVSVLIVAASASLAQAQAPGRTPANRYSPARPTVSPYLNLLRRDVGPLPNYYSLVRPQLNQVETNRQQQVINNQQQSQIQDNSRRILEGTNSNAAPTGTGAVYRSYSHYYPSMR